MQLIVTDVACSVFLAVDHNCEPYKTAELNNVLFLIWT